MIIKSLLNSRSDIINIITIIIFIVIIIIMVIIGISQVFFQIIQPNQQIIPGARMRLKAEWAIDSEAIRSIGIIIGLVKSNQLVKKKMPRENILHLLKLYFNPLLLTKHYKYGVCFLLPVGYNIQPSSSSTNQNAVLIRPLVGFY